MMPRSRLGKRQLEYLTDRLRDIDTDIFVANVAKEMDDKEVVQLTMVEARGEMWKYWKNSEKLKLLAVFLLNGFCELLETHATGKKRFARFLFSWYEFVSTLAVATRETAASQQIWTEVSLGLSSISSEDRSATIFALASCVYTYLKKELEALNSHWRTVQLQVVEHPVEPDDEVSLYRLFGFALFVSIRYRRRVIYGRTMHRATRQRKQLYKMQLALLNSMLETDKSVAPSCIKFQDRGKMKFPCRTMLPFCQMCSTAIKTYLNQAVYNQLGRKIIIVTKKHILNNQQLVQNFTAFVSDQMGQKVGEDRAVVLYRELVGRVVNTMCNSFFRSHDVLSRIKGNKGVDAQVSLRDKLKVYASEKHATKIIP